jgi:sulfoxide reductase catalytic subunit YedY
MLIRKAPELTHADVTPKSVYLNRRNFLRAVGIAGIAAYSGHRLWQMVSPSRSIFASAKLEGFGTDKSDPAKNAQNFKTSPWTVSVEGEVAKPRKFTMDEILKLAPLEERIYRHRCVERWSIVVPWIGYSFSTIANLVQPTPKAKYVAFESFFDPRQMPEAKYGGIDFPYVEGLRLDEAMNPLALFCVGMYGETLPPQDGAPVRMVIPWKYGYKSIKSLVKIRFQEKEPPTTWNRYSAEEYGFYSNVNPSVDHPRWSQAKERRLGEILTRPTIIFNGYSDQVASMYNGMDLKKFH